MTHKELEALANRINKDVYVSDREQDIYGALRWLSERYEITPKTKILQMKVLEQKWWDKTRYLIFCGQGSVQLEIFKEPWGSQGIKAFIWGLYVNEDQRLEGLATALMDEAERIAREQGLESVYLEWEEVNTPLAIYQWYERRGYEEKEMGPGCALMRKELNEQMSNSNEKD